jgi:hypothetical protein
VSVALAVVRLGLISEHCEPLQGIRGGRYLCWGSTAATTLVARANNGNLCQITDTSSLGFAPTKVDCQSTDTVEGMLNVYSTQYCNVLLVLSALFGWRTVVSRTVDAQGASKLVPPSWVDLIQDS